MSDLKDLFMENGWTLSLAESCTGGLIASMITKEAGSSGYFLGSFVTYSEKLKEKVLGVKEETLSRKGVVSGSVAKEMCEGALRVTGSTFAVAVTGDAGPAGNKVGTVYGAIGRKGEVYTFLIPELEGLSRNKIQQKCADFLLQRAYTFAKTGKVELVN